MTWVKLRLLSSGLSYSDPADVGDLDTSDVSDVVIYEEHPLGITCVPVLFHLFVEVLPTNTFPGCLTGFTTVTWPPQGSMGPDVHLSWCCVLSHFSCV